MAEEATTIARPYAEAVFQRALETEKLALWADMLELLESVARDPLMKGLIANPRLDRSQMTELMLDIGGGRLSDEGQNLVRLLVRNDRLAVLPEINSLFIEMKNAQEGALDVSVVSAFPMKPAAEQKLVEVLSKKLGREVHIKSEQDPELIGGVRIRAGDMVIDGTVQGQLSQLANELGI